MTDNVNQTHKVTTSETTGHTVLLCPRCGGRNLHHEMVAHHIREREDGMSSVCFIPAQATAPLGGNPSARRGGVVISFTCEGCGPGLELTLAQHKGDTELGWRYVTA